MKRDAVMGAALLFTGILLAGIGFGSVSRQPDKNYGDRFPSLALTALDGSAAPFDPRGRPAIVTVFATWCVPCREEFSKIARTSSQPWASRVKFVEIDDGEPSSRVAEFVRAYPELRATVLIDASHAVHELGIYSMPRTVAVRSDGRVVGHFDGPMAYSDLRALVNKATQTVRHK